MKYYEGWASGPLAGPGNFLALKLTAVKVGLNPSQGTGLVEIINDPDKNIVMKINDKERQMFEVLATKNGKQTSKTYSLSGLVLESDEA